jgi:beta-1,4-mannosyl-glycoprotein beta-1,4-N-acetylglucosaminyltransferase
MLIDCFTFFNELDLLEGRLEYLYNTVDQFVIVESNRTHSCKLKSLNFIENKKRYEKYLDKITYLVWENNNESTPNAWIPESSQRNYILEGLKNVTDDAWVIISDLDEIPKISAIEYGISSNSVDSTFDQQMFWYNLKQREYNGWKGSVLTKVSNVKKNSPQFYRGNREAFNVLYNGGWHLSYWGTVDRIKQKIESFAHQEFNNDFFKNEDSIKEKVITGSDLYGRGEGKFLSINREDLDPELLKYFSKYEVII